LTEVSRAGPDVAEQAAALGPPPHEGVDHVVDVDEVAGLLAVTEDGHRLLVSSRSAKMATTPASPWGS
jgi:hypothetical protein